MPASLIQVLQSSLNMLTAESLNRIVSTNESEAVLTNRGFQPGIVGGRSSYGANVENIAASGA